MWLVRRKPADALLFKSGPKNRAVANRTQRSDTSEHEHEFIGVPLFNGLEMNSSMLVLVSQLRG